VASYDLTFTDLFSKLGVKAMWDASSFQHTYILYVTYADAYHSTAGSWSVLILPTCMQIFGCSLSYAKY
jgi:hypothetical protein